MRAGRTCLAFVLMAALLPMCSTESPPITRAGAGVPGRAATAGEVEQAQFVSFRHAVMGTELQVLLPAAADADDADDAAQAVFRVFDDVDARMSEWKATSPLSAVNRNAGSAVRVPDDVRIVVRKGLALGELTKGAFDITWAALWGLWDFKAPVPRLPPADTLRAASALVDFHEVEVDDRRGTVRLRKPGMKLGLGGIAKGYALERAAAVLRARGIDDFMLSAGGQVFAGGSKGERPWKVGIRDPRGGQDDFFASLSVQNASVSTSGDYERFFIVDGIRYHHILDPRTGMPARGVRSATVVATDPTLADALSTAAMVMGAQAGLALIENHANVEGLLVDDHGKVHTTTGVRAQLLRLPRRD